MSDPTTCLVITAASAGLRRVLRPIEWMVLEDVALDARLDRAGVLVAATSARRVAEHLGLTPGAAARALAGLRTAGLVTHHRQPGPAGRFGLSAYILLAPPGVAVVEERVIEELGDGSPVASPRPVSPHVAPPRPAKRHVVALPTTATPAGTEITAGGPRRSPTSGRGVGGGAGAPARTSQAADGAPAPRDRGVDERRRRAVEARPERRVDQLSILDIVDDADLHTGPRKSSPRPRATTTATSPDQRRSARHDERIARPANPSA